MQLTRFQQIYYCVVELINGKMHCAQTAKNLIHLKKKLHRAVWKD